ncbi:MAG: hypothetical protein NTV86_04275, partial [Planctomycetota bacterium]|nr:hypothetical protein [Planctomycetota bacterium]
DKALMNFALYVETLQKLLDAPEANGLAKDRIAGLLGPSGASEAALRAKYAQLLAANGNVKPYDWDDGGGAARFCILGEEPALLKVNVEPGKRYMILAVAERNLALAVAVVSGAPEVDPSPAKVVAVGHKSTGAERFSLSFSAQTAGIHVMTIRKEAGDELSPLVIGVVREK